MIITIVAMAMVMVIVMVIIRVKAEESKEIITTIVTVMIVTPKWNNKYYYKTAN